VIPCYNYARFLVAAVGSVLTQTGVDVEVIVVDDASTDDSLAVAHRLAEGDARVRVRAHATNQGPVQTFNDGLEWAEREFLVRLDADDLLTPGSLRRSVAVARAFPSVGLVYGRPSHFSTEPRPARTDVKSWTVWPGMRWLADRCADGYNVITSPEVLMRRSVVRRTGGQRPLAHTHDMEMWLRIAAFSDVAYIVGPDQAWHRDHAASLSAREVDTLVDFSERLRAFRELGSGAAAGRDGVSELVARATASVAREALTLAGHRLDVGRADFAELTGFLAVAEDADPSVRGTASWTRIYAGARDSRRPNRISTARHRIVGRVSWNRRQRRWSRTGTWTRP
jgi:cellulose synthase/poly-beta-1,6-N-acetylglucosamine synthase-like glycosyltransferase